MFLIQVVASTAKHNQVWNSQSLIIFKITKPIDCNNVYKRTIKVEVYTLDHIILSTSF